MARAALAIASSMFFAAGCGSDVVVELIYPSEGMRDAVTDVEAYVFEGESCERFSPHGAPFADAPARGGVPAIDRRTGRRDTALEAFLGLGARAYTVVVDGYGPGCKRDRREAGGETACAEFDTTARRVHRTHGCFELDGDSDAGRTINLPLLPTAAIGSTMRVSELGVQIFDAEDPLPVTEGLLARQPFVVQLADENRENLDGAPVHWRVTEGAGFIQEAQPALTAPGKYDTTNQSDVEANGLSFGTVHAGTGGSGAITVEAYAPGREGSPAVFHARALPATSVELSSVLIDRQTIDLSHPLRIRPVLVTDVDQDGLADVVLSSYDPGNCNPESSTHQIAVVFGGAEDAPVVSARSEGLLYSMVYVESDASGGRRLVAFVSDPCASAREDTEHGRQTRVKALAVEAWALGRDGITPAGRVTSETSSVAPHTARPIEKIGISADAADLVARDGAQEIAVSRCSYAEGANYPIDCQSPIQLHHDGEIAVMRPLFTDGRLSELRLLSVLTAAQTLGGDRGGGFGEVRFVDLDGNGLPDLTWTRPELVLGICSANFPETGYELGNKNRIFQHPANFTWGYSLGAGNFTRSPGLDIIVSGGGRATGRVSGATLLESTGCGFIGAADVVVGAKVSNPDGVLVRVADINNDGLDDAIVLLRSLGEIHTYLGSGAIDLATGPVADLQDGETAGFAVGFEGGGDDRKVLAVTYSPRDNRVMIAKFYGRVLR